MSTVARTRTLKIGQELPLDGLTMWKLPPVTPVSKTDFIVKNKK